VEKVLKDIPIKTPRQDTKIIRVNDQPHSGWLYYAVEGRERKRNVGSHV
jgi:hypothetical protein